MTAKKKAKPVVEWSAADLETLRSIRNAGASLDANMHRLPGKTYYEADKTARLLGLKHASVEVRGLRVMSDGKPRTAGQLAVEIGSSRTSACDMLHNASLPGVTQKVHVCGFTPGGRPLLIYVAGQGINEQPRVARSKAVWSSDPESALDEQYKAKASWWPRADQVVISAINAMVHAGRAAA